MQDSSSNGSRSLARQARSTHEWRGRSPDETLQLTCAAGARWRTSQLRRCRRVNRSGVQRSEHPAMDGVRDVRAEASLQLEVLYAERCTAHARASRFLAALDAVAIRTVLTIIVERVTDRHCFPLPDYLKRPAPPATLSVLLELSVPPLFYCRAGRVVRHFCLS